MSRVSRLHVILCLHLVCCLNVLLHPSAHEHKAACCSHLVHFFFLLSFICWPLLCLSFTSPPACTFVTHRPLATCHPLPCVASVVSRLYPPFAMCCAFATSPFIMCRLRSCCVALVMHHLCCVALRMSHHHVVTLCHVWKWRGGA